MKPNINIFLNLLYLIKYHQKKVNFETYLYKKNLLSLINI